MLCPRKERSGGHRLPVITAHRWPSDGIDRTQEYESILTRLMKGARAGHVTDAFNIRWNVLAGYIAEQQRQQLIDSTEALHNLWVEHDDARGYILHGDPAVRLNLEKMT